MEADVTRPPLVRRAHLKLQMTPDQGGRCAGSKILRTFAQQYPPAYEVSLWLADRALACTAIASPMGISPRPRRFRARLSRERSTGPMRRAPRMVPAGLNRPVFGLCSRAGARRDPGLTLCGLDFYRTRSCPATLQKRRNQGRKRRTLTAFLKEEAAAKGFDICRITHPDAITPRARAAEAVPGCRRSWYDELARRDSERRSDPRVLWSEVARSSSSA